MRKERSDDMSKKKYGHNLGKRIGSSALNKWLQPDNLELMSAWARDGYTFNDIANRIGISLSTLSLWRQNYEEIEQALRLGREIIDYKVENALLKSALGYRSREVKITSKLVRGKMLEVQKEVSIKEQPPNVGAIQTWLYNRQPDKWKRNRDNIIDLDEMDNSINIVVKRANKEVTQKDLENDDWDDLVNDGVSIERSQNVHQGKGGMDLAQDIDEIDVDYWPDDWNEGS